MYRSLAHFKEEREKHMQNKLHDTMYDHTDDTHSSYVRDPNIRPRDGEPDQGWKYYQDMVRTHVQALTESTKKTRRPDSDDEPLGWGRSPARRRDSLEWDDGKGKSDKGRRTPPRKSQWSDDDDDWGRRSPSRKNSHK